MGQDRDEHVEILYQALHRSSRRHAPDNQRVYVINADTGKRYGNIGGRSDNWAEQQKNNCPKACFTPSRGTARSTGISKISGRCTSPRKGDKIVLERTNSLLYKKNNRVGERLSAYPQQRYIVGQWNSASIVYFLAQLLFYGRRQSRKLAGFPLLGGLLPDDLIVGKAAFIWKSKEPYSGKIRWKRILKKIEWTGCQNWDRILTLYFLGGWVFILLICTCFLCAR